MKKQILIVLSAVTCLLSACSTTNFAYYDDIYSSTEEKSANSATPTAANPTAQNATVEADSIIYETDENGNLLRTLTYYPGSSEPVITTYMEVVDDSTATPAAIGGSSGTYTYDPDDYYDYSYSSRIRRFHTDVNVGWGYYDPFFTNLYWYDYCPASWGISIYMGYNWWWPNYYYRPYYYDPVWYNCGFNYGWGWYRPYPVYAWDPYVPHHPHGPMPVDWYHNNRDPNHSYYYGHRNNLGPSVGNGGDNGDNRPTLPDPNNSNGPVAGGYGNGATNNYYSTTPASFNQRYESIAGTTAAPTTSTSRSNAASRIAKNESQTNRTHTNVQPTANTVNTDAHSSASTASDVSRTVDPRQAASQTTGSSTTTPSRTVTRTVVTSPRTNTNTTGSTTTTTRTTKVTRPSSSTSTQTTTTTTAPRQASTTTRTTTRTTTTTRPSSSSTPANSRPSSSSSSRSRNTYSSPSSDSRTSTSNPSRNSRPSYSSPSSSSRPSYSSPSSSSRSSYSSPSSSSRSSYSGSSHSSSSGSRVSGGRR